MLILGNILALSSLTGLIIQDLRSRSVSVILLIVFTTACIALGFEQRFVARYLLFNLSFLFILLSALCLYSLLRWKKASHFLDHGLGKGDLLFFLPLIFLFSAQEMVFFFCGSLMLSLVVFILWSLITRKNILKVEFPLISGMGICLVFVLVWKWVVV